MTPAAAKMLVGSLLLAALLWGVTRLVRRLPVARYLPGAQGPIRVVARTHLGARESLCLVTVGPTSILLAITAQSIRALHVWPAGVGTSPSGGGDTPPTNLSAPPAVPPQVPGQLRNLQAWLPGRER
jgi:flagellar biogenesis protein FliO